MSAETPAPTPPAPPPPGEQVRAELAGTRFADVRWVATTGSTNSDAMALARSGAPEGIVLVADHQDAGRGRLGRTWQAPPGSSLLVSVLLRPPAAIADCTTMAAGLAMADAVAAVAGVEATLKWPNDLVVTVDDADRKLAGILAEADWPAAATVSAGYVEPRADERVVVVVGIGLNVNWPDQIPPELADVMVAANHLAGRSVDREAILVSFLRGLDERDRRLRAAPGDLGWLLDQWRARSATLGRAVRVDLGAREVTGTAVDVDERGRLIVETVDAERLTLAVGDVVHLRAAP